MNKIKYFHILNKHLVYTEMKITHLKTFQNVKWKKRIIIWLAVLKHGWKEKVCVAILIIILIKGTEIIAHFNIESQKELYYFFVQIYSLKEKYDFLIKRNVEWINGDKQHF